MRDGLERGRQEGIKQGEFKKAQEIARNLLQLRVFAEEEIVFFLCTSTIFFFFIEDDVDEEEDSISSSSSSFNFLFAVVFIVGTINSISFIDLFNFSFSISAIVGENELLRSI